MAVRNGDMRNLLASILYGSANNPPEGHPVILRKMRRDTNGKLVRCPYSSSPRGKQQIHGANCILCDGEGWVWDEYWVTTYSRHNSIGQTEFWGFAGDTNPEKFIYYFEYDVPVTVDDKIIEPEVDANGVPTSPYAIDQKYTISYVEKKKGDFGRVEFIQVVAEKQLN